jgi:adenylylsulfate kinase
LKNIFPVYGSGLVRGDKEALLKQRSVVVWLVGLSGSGKSTLAKGLEKMLHDRGYLTMLLDGDNLRTGVNRDLGFTGQDREENIRRAAEVSKLFMLNGTITICSFITPTTKIRDLARGIIGVEDFYEVYVNCPLKICESRDVKGLYARARAGEIQDFTGVDAPLEAPEDPDIEIRTDQLEIQESLDLLVAALEKRIEYR